MCVFRPQAQARHSTGERDTFKVPKIQEQNFDIKFLHQNGVSDLKLNMLQVVLALESRRRLAEGSRSLPGSFKRLVVHDHDDFGDDDHDLGDNDDVHDYDHDDDNHI